MKKIESWRVKRKEGRAGKKERKKREQIKRADIKRRLVERDGRRRNVKD